MLPDAMFRFCPDDSTVLFLDCFGLTRLTQPKKLKTDRQISWGSDSSLTLSEHGDQALLHDSNRRRADVYTLPALKREHILDQFESKIVHLLPDGRHLLCENAIYTLDGLDQVGELATERAKILDPLVFGRPKQVGSSISNPYPEQVCAHGTVAGIIRHDEAWALSWGRCTHTGGQLAWVRPFLGHRGYHHALYPHAQGVVVTALAPRDGTVWATWVDAKGNTGRTVEAPGLTTPVWARGRLAWQVDEDTIIVTDAAGEQVNYSISAATHAAHTGKKHPRDLKGGNFLGDLKNTGRGSILLGASAVWFVPWHGETLLDLVHGTELHRKLPEDQFVARQMFCENVQQAAALAREADTQLHAFRCVFDKKARRYEIGWSLTRGEGGLVGLLVSCAVGGSFNEDPARFNVDGWRRRCGSVSALEFLSGTYGVDDLLRAFKILDTHRIHLFWSLWKLLSVYKRRLEGFDYYGETLGPVLTRDAEKLFLQAFLESAAGAPQHHLDVERRYPTFRLLDRVEQWRAAELTREGFMTRANQVKRYTADGEFYEYLARSYFDDAIKPV